ncbi:hypothetical protein EMIT036CA2_20668 [Chryseobacterium sp. IT-36CA2]
MLNIKKYLLNDLLTYFKFLYRKLNAKRYRFEDNLIIKPIMLIIFSQLFFENLI